MSASEAVAGWYSDPSNPGALRWWDGTQWTADSQPLNSGPPAVAPHESGAPVPTAPMTYGLAPGQYAPPHGQPAYGQGQGQPTYGQGQGQPTYQQGQQGQQGQFPPQGAGYGATGGFRRRGGVLANSRSPFVRRNQASLTGAGFAAIYVVIAATTGFVLIGIVPVMMCMRAFQRKEPLAPLAGLAAVVAVGTFILFLH
jgi:hypothetical protein